MLDASATGVGTYADVLLRALGTASIAPLVLVDGRDDAAPPAGVRSWPIARWLRAALPGERPAIARGGRLLVPDVFREAHLHFRLRRRLLAIRVDGPAGIIHFTYPVPLRIVGWRNLYTVHDAIPLTHPELTRIPARRHRAVLRQLLVAGGNFVTVSAAARAEIVGALGCAPGRVTDLGQAVDMAAAPGCLPAGLREREYLLFCGSIEPRKNIVRMAEAYRRSGTARPLVIAGPLGWHGARVRAKVREVPGVVMLPYQPRATLLALIAGARALLLPSLAEGFGLPIAEAMALGTPVMTSRGGATAEVAGDAALLADPHDVAEMAATIRALAADDALCDRLRRAGLERAEAFTVAEYGARLAAFYGRVAQRRVTIGREGIGEDD